MNIFIDWLTNQKKVLYEDDLVSVTLYGRFKKFRSIDLILNSLPILVYPLILLIIFTKGHPFQGMNQINPFILIAITMGILSIVILKIHQESRKLRDQEKDVKIKFIKVGRNMGESFNQWDIKLNGTKVEKFLLPQSPLNRKYLYFALGAHHIQDYENVLTLSYHQFSFDLEYELHNEVINPEYIIIQLMENPTQSTN